MDMMVTLGIIWEHGHWKGHMGVLGVALVRYCRQMHYDMPDASLADIVMFTI